METQRWQSVYEQVVLPFVLAFAVVTVGVGAGFVYPLLAGGAPVTASALALRWVGVAAGLFGGAAFAWWLVVEPSTRRLLPGAFGIGLLTLAEAVGGGYLVLMSDFATSLFALVAAALTALSLVLLAGSLAAMMLWRNRYGRGLLVAHWLLALAVPAALILADRALPFEPDPVIGLIFVIVPFIALLHVANAVLLRMWFEHEPRRSRRAVRGL